MITYKIRYPWPKTNDKKFLLSLVNSTIKYKLEHLPFKPSLMFAGKAGACSREALFRGSTLG